MSHCTVCQSEIARLEEERDALAVMVAEMRETLKWIEGYCNGPTTETWVREGVIVRARSAQSIDLPRAAKIAEARRNLCLQAMIFVDGNDESALELCHAVDELRKLEEAL